jgi:hypothetical protein
MRFEPVREVHGLPQHFAERSDVTRKKGGAEYRAREVAIQ